MGVFHEENQKAHNVAGQGQFNLSESKENFRRTFQGNINPIIKGSLNTSKGLTHSASIYPVAISFHEQL